MMLLELHQIAPWWGIWAAIVDAVILSRRHRRHHLPAARALLRARLDRGGGDHPARRPPLQGLHPRRRGVPALRHPAAAALRDVAIEFFGKRPFFYAALGLAVIVVAANWIVQHSKLGYYFQAIREDQDAAHCLGINPTLLQDVALAISAAFTAWAGGALRDLREVHRPEHRLRPRRVGADRPHLHHRRDRDHPRAGRSARWCSSRSPRCCATRSGSCRSGSSRPTRRSSRFIEQRLSNTHVLVYGILVVVVILFAPDGILGVLRRSVAARLREAARRRTAPRATAVGER